jgi:hypothetical protein
MLFISFWHLSLENFLEGTFTHRCVSRDEAKNLIDDSRARDRLRGVSQDDLFAPYNEREANNHTALRRALADSHGITLSLDDFVLEADEFDDGGGDTIHPLQFAQVNETSQLLVVNCNYLMARPTKDRALGFEVSAESITFHLFEAIAKAAQ